MNEIIFVVQLLCIIIFACMALRLGSATLTTWVAIQAIMANLFVLKQITLFGFHVTASDAFAIGSLMGLNFLQEYYGQAQAKQATNTCFLFLFFFAIISQLHIWYIPSPSDSAHSAFATLLSPSPRLFMASMATFFIVQQFDIAFFAFLRKRLPHTAFAIRSVYSLTLSQFLDTVLFTLFGLYGIASNLIDIIVLSFSIKLLSILTFTVCCRYSNYFKIQTTID